MLIKIFLIAAMLFSTTVNAQNKDFAEKLMQLSEKELYDTAYDYLKRNILDTALIYYNQVIKTPAKASDIEQQSRIVNAYSNLAVIYMRMNDYPTAYEFLLKGLTISEKHKVDKDCKPTLYLNIGNIYNNLDEEDLAKSYYSKALNMNSDSSTFLIALSNLVALDKNVRDSALFILNQSAQISKTLRDIFLANVLANIAVSYQREGLYDSTLHYLRYLRLVLGAGTGSTLPEFYKVKAEAQLFSNLGKIFYQINQPDSAILYINLSNAIAAENKFFPVMADNYRYLYKIEEEKGNIRKALEHHKTHSNFKDSIQSAAELGKINQLQRLYEISKTNQEIEQHIIDKQIKDNTIYYQKIILYISLFVLLLISTGFIVVYLQKKNLNRAYKALFEKNIEIENLEKTSEKRPEIKPEKTGTITLTTEMQRELLQKILTVMNDKSVICDPDFTVDKLAAIIQSNQAYVSHVINSCLKKNFRALLNGYRISEAKRILAESDIINYSISHVASKVGYKSQSTFFDTFKEVTGITPKFYLKSIQARNSLQV